MTPCPSGNTKRSTWGLIFSTLTPFIFSKPSISISLSKCPMFPTMALFFIFFMDGAQHICQAWGACHPYKTAGQPREFTCDECVEGMEFVEAYMRDPLWVAEYTLYPEQNFCVHDQGDMKCVDMVKTHFPPMHEIGMEAFVPQSICDH